MLELVLVLSALLLPDARADYTDTVIDISHYQTNVDFALIKKSGISAVIHKATQGKSFVDSEYKERRGSAGRVDLLWGAYHFGVSGDPVEQADHFLDTVGDTDGVLLAIDLEDNRNRTMSPPEADEFVKRIKERTGRYPLIYGNRYFLKPFDMPNLNKCSLWIALYSSRPEPILPPFRDSWVLWQYTDGEKGGCPREVPGVGPCDRDRFNGTVEELKNVWPDL